MLTFALNWYFSKSTTFSYHLVNISIHILTALFLYLTIYHLLTRTFYSTRNQISNSTAQLTALFAVLLWALNPIQTQAVTYIVQRMASMAAMFYIMAVFFYLRARSTNTTTNRILAGTTTFLCFLLAMGSKENAITLPFALILVELLLLQDLDQKRVKQRLLIIFFSICGLFLFLSSIMFLNGDLLSFLNGYHSRSFTFTERILTEPRVVLHYLYQIFYPVTSHLSFEHDIILSQSLLKPWTTLPAIASIILLLISALLTYRKVPFYSFAVLFFFLNHIIESSIIPLEIVFEHRNYLPSMFLFVPVALLLHQGIQHLKKQTPLLSKMLILFSALLIFLSGFSTYSRNEVWATEGTLWEDTYQKSPNSSRAAHNLGRWYRQHGQFQKAMSLFQQAEENSAHGANAAYTRANALNGQGTIYYYTDSPKRAIETFQEALAAYPRFEASRKNLALTFLQIQQWPEALKESSQLVKQSPNNAEYHYIHAISLLRNEQPELSLTYAETALEKYPDSPNLILANAAIHKALKQYNRAKHNLYQYDKIDPGNLRVGLALLEISIQEHDNATTEKMKSMIQQKYTTEDITNALATNQLIPLYSQEILGKIFSRDM